MSEETKTETDHTMKDVTDTYPGKMAVADVRGTYSGCTMKEFRNTDEVNEFFKRHLGLLVVDIKPTYSEGILVTYTAQQTADYVRRLTELQERVTQMMAEERAKELEGDEKKEEARIAAEREARRLQAVGRTCEDHHKPLIEKVRKLEDEVKKMRKGKS